MRTIIALLKSFVFVIFLLALLQFSACSAFYPTESSFANKDFSNKPVNLHNFEDRREYYALCSKIAEARNLWKEKNISNYDFELERRVEGVGGDWTLIFKVRDYQTLPIEEKDKPAVYHERLNSVDKLFEYIREDLEEGNRVSVEFDKEYGFPKDVSVKGKGNGWQSYKIKKFENR